jgi:Holliday junction DNA helicase RuvB
LLTALAFQHLGLAVPQGFSGVQASLFEEGEDE